MRTKIEHLSFNRRYPKKVAVQERFTTQPQESNADATPRLIYEVTKVKIQLQSYNSLNPIHRSHGLANLFITKTPCTSSSYQSTMKLFSISIYNTREGLKLSSISIYNTREDLKLYSISIYNTREGISLLSSRVNTPLGLIPLYCSNGGRKSPTVDCLSGITWQSNITSKILNEK